MKTLLSVILLVGLVFSLFTAAAAARLEGLSPQQLAAISLPKTERVSVASDGSQGNNDSGPNFGTLLSMDGRYVAFQSDASNLVSGDTNDQRDVFVHDRVSEATERVSVASDGSQASGNSEEPSFSSDGRFVAFQSDAANLVSNDTNSKIDIFVHDRQTGVTERVSVATDGSQANNISTYPAISADGRFVGFQSTASNLVSGDTNAKTDIFVHDRQTGVTERVSIATDGSQGESEYYYWEPALSADGRFVVFSSYSSNLVNGDTNGSFDVFVHDRLLHTTERVSVSSTGTQGNYGSLQAAISADGRYVAFPSAATNLVNGDTNNRQDVFVRDRQAGVTERVSVATDGSQGNDDSEWPSISANGNVVTFQSAASNLVSGDNPGSWDVFVHNRQTGVTERISVATDGSRANDNAGAPSISAGGRFVLFGSHSTNLVSDDTNNAGDAFVRDLGGYNIYLPVTFNPLN